MSDGRSRILNLLPQFPVLRRELTELANRRRTYIIRIVGAIALLSVVFIVLQIATEQAAARKNPSGFGGFGRGGVTDLMGIGRGIFSSVVPCLFRAIQLLMPALCCGAITIEKERNTLGTLFLTRLSPFSIILEKLGSRLVPMMTFLLLTFPVLAYVYSLGGVDVSLLFCTLWLLVCECLFYASIGMFCSSWFRTTVSAFMCSYILVAVLLVSSAALGMLTLTPFDLWLRAFADEESGFVNGIGLAAGAATGSEQTLLIVIGIMAMSVPSLMMASAFIGLARFFLIRRAFVTGSSPILRVFRRLDRFFVILNEHTTRGIELVKDTNSLPLFDPIAWRERSKKSLGKARYLFRILTVLEIPTLVVCSLAATAGVTGGFAGLQIMLAMLWTLTALLIAVKASTAISSERDRETMEALFSTPMTAAEIVKEKVAGMRRLLIVLAIPILTTHFTIVLLNIDLRQVFVAGGLPLAGLLLAYLTLTTLTTVIVMSVLAWLSTGVGMYFHSQTKSVLVAVVVTGIWVALPLLIGIAVVQPFSMLAVSVTPSRAVASIFSLIGPIVMNEVWFEFALGNTRHFLQREPVSNATVPLTIVFPIVLQFGVWMVLRWVVLSWAPRLMGRSDGQPKGAASHVPVFQPQTAH